MRSLRVWIPVVVCLVLVSASQKPQTTRLRKPTTPTKAKLPDFPLKGIDGNTYNLTDFKGKVVLLNWFASW